MRFLTLYWWEWVAYLFGFSSIIINGLSLLTTFKKKPMLNGSRALTPTSQNSKESTALPSVQPQGKKTVWIASMTLILGMVLGYVGRDLSYMATRYLYTEVQVIERYDATHFKVQPARMRPYNWTTCSPVDWEKNQRMEFVHYSQRVGCKDVGANGAYKFHEQNGRRINYQQETADGRF